MSPGPRPTSVPSGILIHPAVWPQKTCAENWGLHPFLVNVNSRSRSLERERDVRYLLSPVRLSSVCLSSVTLVRTTQVVQIFGNISMALGTLAIVDIHQKFYGDRPRETPPSGELNTTGVAKIKYSNFGPIEGYISEMVQDRR